MNVKHDEKNSAFILVDENGEQAGKLEYQLSRRGVLFARRVFVEEKHRGKGLGKPLVDAIVDYARANDYKIRPVCPYVAALFEKHPEIYSDIACHKSEDCDELCN